VTVTRAIDPPAWHGTLAAQIAWATLVLAASLLALGLRSGVPTRNAVAMDTLALLSLPAALALIVAEDGQGIPMLGGYPLPLWPAVALTAAGVAVTARLIAAHTPGATATRQRVTLFALAAASASSAVRKSPTCWIQRAPASWASAIRSRGTPRWKEMALGRRRRGRGPSRMQAPEATKVPA
jgi:hypothetical protein